MDHDMTLAGQQQPFLCIIFLFDRLRPLMAVAQVGSQR